MLRIDSEYLSQYTTEELYNKMQELNSKTLYAPPHLRVQLAETIQIMGVEYHKRKEQENENENKR